MNTVMQEYFDRMFGEIHSRFDRVEERLDRVESRLDRVEERLDSLEARFETIEARFDNLEAEVKGLGERVGKVEDRFGWLYNAIGELFETFAGNLTERMDRVETRVVTCFELVDKRNGILADRMGFVELGLNKMTGHVGDLTVEIRQYLRQASAALN